MRVRDDASKPRMLGRAVARRCLLCGQPGIFSSWLRLRERCPGCGYSFEREEGYWVGAMIMNTGAAQLLFFAVFIGGMVAFWPDPPWGWLLGVGVTVMVAFPVAFYPLSKTIWLWFDFLLHPPD